MNMPENAPSPLASQLKLDAHWMPYTANKCLQAAPKMELISRAPVRCACAFGELALVKLRVADLGGLVVEENFTANGVELQLAVGEAHIELLQTQLADLSRGRILLQR